MRRIRRLYVISADVMLPDDENGQLSRVRDAVRDFLNEEFGIAAEPKFTVLTTQFTYEREETFE